MKWICHEREAQVIYSLTTNRQPVIYWATKKLVSNLYHTRNDEKASVSFKCFPVFAIT